MSDGVVCRLFLCLCVRVCALVFVRVCVCVACDLWEVHRSVHQISIAYSHYLI